MVSFTIFILYSSVYIYNIFHLYTIEQIFETFVWLLFCFVFNCIPFNSGKDKDLPGLVSWDCWRVNNLLFHFCHFSLKQDFDSGGFQEKVWKNSLGISLSIFWIIARRKYIPKSLPIVCYWVSIDTCFSDSNSDVYSYSIFKVGSGHKWQLDATWQRKVV